MSLVHEYEITAEDLLALNEHVSDKLYGVRLRLIRWLPPAALLLACGIAWLAGAAPSTLVAMVVGALFWPASFPFMFRRASRKGVQRILATGAGASIICRHHLLLLDEALVEKTPVSENRTNWAAVGPVEESELHLIVFVGAGVAHPIPKASFADRHARDAFVQEIEKRRAAATAPAR